MTDQPLPSINANDVQGFCPACGHGVLMLGDGGHVVCTLIDCPDPDAVDKLLTRTDDEPTTADDGPKPDFTSPIAGRIEVRQPCPYCVAPTMIPSTLLTDHIARLHNVGLATYGPYPAADEDAQRTTRRASLHNLIVHATQGALTTDECAMLWRHVEAEQREADTARADADRLEEETIGELNEVATRLARENEQLRAGRETWKAKGEEIERDRDQHAAVLAEVLRGFRSVDNQGVTDEGEILGFVGPTVTPETYAQWCSTVAPTAERPWWIYVAQIRAELEQAQAAIERVRAMADTQRARGVSGSTDHKIGLYDASVAILAALDGTEQPTTEA